MRTWSRAGAGRSVASVNLEHRELALLGAIFNLNNPAHVVHWHFIQLSVPNLVVIALMFVVFALAIALPFPGHRSSGSSS